MAFVHSWSWESGWWLVKLGEEAAVPAIRFMPMIRTRTTQPKEQQKEERQPFSVGFDRLSAPPFHPIRSIRFRCVPSHSIPLRSVQFFSPVVCMYVCISVCLYTCVVCPTTTIPSITAHTPLRNNRALADIVRFIFFFFFLTIYPIHLPPPLASGVEERRLHNPDVTSPPIIQTTKHTHTWSLNRRTFSSFMTVLHKIK